MTIENIKDYQVHYYDMSKIRYEYDDKFIHVESVENGHDCWGNIEWSRRCYCFINGKENPVYGKGVLLHKDGKVYYDISEKLYEELSVRGVRDKKLKKLLNENKSS